MSHPDVSPEAPKTMNDPNLNRLLGPYRLKRTVGRGGMGTVYAGQDESGTNVAVKLLSPVLATDASFRDRFMAEIESLQKLQHENIVQLFGYGEQDGQLFYAMELIDGSSLQQEVHQGRRFSWREITRITIDICAALKHAHDHGIIHRDLKPANLLYTPNDRVKLLDFGIAKLFGNTGLTTGSVMGTADYMAPEQAEGKAVGPRTDLYSLGSVMYALLAGRPPFVGKSVPEVVHKVRFEPPIPVGRLADDVPAELEQVIEQLLEKNPQKRIPTALALSHRLKAMEHALSVRENAEQDELDTSFTVGEANEPLTNPGLSNQMTVRLGAGADQDQGTDDSASVREPSDSISAERSGETAGVEIETGPDHYTRVEADASTGRDASGPTWQAIGSTAMLAGLLLAGVVLVRQANRPESADVLYQRISAAEQQHDDPRAILQVDDDIASFLKLYPDDPRGDELRSLESEVELVRLQRQYELKARRFSTPDSAAQQLYLEIIRQIQNDEANAEKRLAAFVAIYQNDDGQDPQLTEEDQQVVSLAANQLVQLKAKERRDAEIHLPFIRRQLQKAAELETSQPKSAEEIRTHLYHLYGSKSWAVEIMAERN